jgi:hypothetical protein
MAAARNNPFWAELGNDALLDIRFCDLKLRLDKTPLARRITRLREELARRGLRFSPHFWLSEEWFSPDAVPGVAIPFYLAHPRLMQLEYRQMFEVEGGTERSCMQLLRHETGHAIDTAYRLHRRRVWRETFGAFERPYPKSYTPRPQSRRYVLHLDWWYAQSHPSEDFAETFAVWLGPRAKWRRDYALWPALKKLCAVDALMHSIAGKPAPVRCRRHVDPLSRNVKTLRQHYAEKRLYYGVEVPVFYDSDLRRLFTLRPRGAKRRRTAAGLLRRLAPQLCEICAHGTGCHPYFVAQLVQEMVRRCRELKLYVETPERQVMLDVAVFLAVQTMNYLHEGQHKVPV